VSHRHGALKEGHFERLVFSFKSMVPFAGRRSNPLLEVAEIDLEPTLQTLRHNRPIADRYLKKPEKIMGTGLKFEISIRLRRFSVPLKLKNIFLDLRGIFNSIPFLLSIVS